MVSQLFESRVGKAAFPVNAEMMFAVVVAAYLTAMQPAWPATGYLKRSLPTRRLSVARLAQEPPADEVATQPEPELSEDEAKMEPDPEADVKLSPVARMRKQREEEARDVEAWKAGRSADLVQQQTIARGIFAVLVAAVAFFVSQSAGLDAPPAIRAPASSVPGLPFTFKAPALKAPTIRTGYEGRSDIGKFRPLFPEAPNSA